MPELPDIELYIRALRMRVEGTRFVGTRIASPFLMRTFDPPISAVAGKRVTGIERVGKRIAFSLDDSLFLVVHLMKAGRFRWEAAGAKVPGKVGLAAFDFERGTLILTEAGTKRRAGVHVLRERAALDALRPPGIEPLEATFDEFRDALVRESHTLKRSLTDPHLFSGIGNAYSDEILHRAKLSPLARSTTLTGEEIGRLRDATRAVLSGWRDALARETGDEFPEKVTAFRPDMAVHGKYGAPCPECGTDVQRIVYAETETNYCPTCQTGGRLLADRALSRLLGKDWPKSLEELEEHLDARRPVAPPTKTPSPATNTKPGKPARARRASTDR